MSVEREAALALYRKSVLKQQKVNAILEFLGPVQGCRCLDLGGDNGVVSLLLRRQGGSWSSGDIGREAVTAIRELAGGDVREIEGEALPWSDAEFDVVVVADFLEHVEDDAAAAEELARVLKPGGRIIVNVPHRKPRSVLAKVRNRIGLTDAWHGHVRPGYDIGGLRQLLRPWFSVDRVRTYCGSFSEAIDTLLNGTNLLLHGGGHAPKGPLMTGGELRKRGKELRLLTLLYPGLWLISRLDRLLPFQAGYRLIVSAERMPVTPGEVGPELAAQGAAT